MANELPRVGNGAGGAIVIGGDQTVVPGEDAQLPRLEVKDDRTDDRPHQLFPEGGGGEVDAKAIGRNQRGAKSDLRVFGASIPRLGERIKIPSFADKAIANLVGGLFANRGLLADKGVNAYRDVASVDAAIGKALVAPQNAYGPLTIFRPGLGNTAPGPAQIARMAQYTDKLIIAYANPGSLAEQKLHPVTEIDGVPLPPSIRGKVFAVGSPKNLMISYEQASDLFLSQLNAMQGSEHLRGVDIKSAKATVIAHSQGGLDATLTRRRLADIGFDDVFGKLITLATPFKGSPVSDETMAGVFSGVGAAFDAQALNAIDKLDPDTVAKVLRETDRRFVELALVGQCEAGPEGRDNLRTTFKVSDAAIEATKLFGSMWRGRDSRENDGLVTVDSQRFGQSVLVLKKSYDHAGIAEDAEIADILARQLTS